MNGMSTNLGGLLFSFVCTMTILLCSGCGSKAAPKFPAYSRLVMTWVPPYAVENCRKRLEESYEGFGMKDGLTHLGLQFWVPTLEGGIARTGHGEQTSDATIMELRDRAHDHGVRVLLCLYNGAEGWDWSLSRKAFTDHPGALIDALLAEVNRLQLDGVDIDLEGIGSFEDDKKAYVAFVKKLSERLHAEDHHLTLDTFAYKWNVPNQTWWADLLPHVDGLTTMGYEETGWDAPKWRGYAAQKEAAGGHASKLMIGLPSGRNAWRGHSVMEHLQWLKEDGQVGVSFWDAQLRSDSWRTPEVWRSLEEIRGR